MKNINQYITEKILINKDTKCIITVKDFLEYLKDNYDLEFEISKFNDIYELYNISIEDILKLNIEDVTDNHDEIIYYKEMNKKAIDGNWWYTYILSKNNKCEFFHYINTTIKTNKINEYRLGYILGNDESNIENTNIFKINA